MRQKDPPKVYIIILNLNGKEDTEECLQSLIKITYPNYKILIVDNGSTDGSVEYIKQQFPAVEIISNSENKGFAEGNNIGIKYAIEKGTNYVLLLNNDTIVDPNFISELVKIAEGDPIIGVVGPFIYYYNNVDTIQSAGINISWNTCKQNILLSNQKNNGQFKTLIEADYISGCALLAKTELFDKVGFFNSKFFLYWEETDWCARVNRYGYKIICTPSAKIWHKGSATANKYQGLTAYYMTRNRFWFMKRNAKSHQYLLYIIYFFVCKVLFNYILLIIYYQDWNSFISFNKGIIDGVKGEVNWK